MKKALSAIIISIILFSSSSTSYAAVNQIKVDGIVVVSDVQPEMKNDRTMVPVRVISESLGANVEWSNPDVIITKGDMKVILTLNSDKAVVNGKQVVLDVKPYKKNDRVLVPLRFIAETFGCTVSYSNYVVTIDTPSFMIGGVK